MRRALFFALALSLSACRQDAAQDLSPVEISAETLGHFCQMNLLEHEGPKAQVHLEGLEGTPLFFSQVRDAIAYQRLPEQSHPILAIHVNDMGAPDATWQDPGRGNWIDAEDAFFVLGSAREGAMGAPEAVPFSSRQDALAFAAQEGGEVLQLAGITDDQVLAPAQRAHDVGDAQDDTDFEDRLRSLSRQEKD